MFFFFSISLLRHVCGILGRCLILDGRCYVSAVGTCDALLYCVCEKKWSYLENSDCLALVSIVCSIQEPRRCVHDR